MPVVADDLGRLSPTLAAAFLGCSASAAWTIEARRGLRTSAERPEDPQGALVLRKGLEHEATCLTDLRERWGDHVEIPPGDPGARFAATLEAMSRGVPLIYQAALLSNAWIGYADFLVRVDEACPQWAWSYEPWDAKLSRSARPEQVLQIALYGDFLAAVQGCPAERGHLMLGTGDAEIRHRVESFALQDVRYYVRRAARRLEAFAGDLPTDLAPEPCGHCGKCDWLSACEGRWEETDHLCRVADITKAQRRRLTAAGISTLSMLAGLNGARVVGINPDALARLVQQARLQKESATTGSGTHEVLPHGPGLGFDRLPTPDPGDLFFDFEGDPMHPGCLEYLCGVLWHAATGDADGEPVPGHPHLRFRAFWAHDREQEKQAFSELMTFIMGHLERAREAHLYHYAPYEKSALRRLASMHATAEAAVDQLLRSERMVDLYRVVREGIRVGEPSYSIKNLERFYMPARTTAVTSGGESLVIYDRFRQTGDTSFLAQLRDYNRDDCLSTLLLRDWLIERANEAGRCSPPETVVGATLKGEEDPSERDANREAAERRQASLEAALTSDPNHADAEARQLMADLVGFHRREAKPVWWAFFDRQERTPEELQDDDECLGGCVADGQDWLGREKRSFTFRYRFPAQETKLRKGAEVWLAATGEGAGTIAALDEAAATVTIKRGTAQGELPKEVCLIPGQTVRTKSLRDAVWAVAEDIASGGDAFPHIRAVLKREPPRLKGRVSGAPVINATDRDDPSRLLAATERAVHALDRSWLVIQGPPGSGKTHATSQMIASLIRAGKTVGVASNSHKAIDNVLHAVEQRLQEEGEAVRLLGQKKDSDAEEGFVGVGFIESVTENGDIDPTIPILGGTAWAFARPELRATRDVLFVDEAGQVSLANLVAMATAAKSIVLVGDQMQLAQPVKGSHPRNSGCSALDHLLEGYAVVPQERGVFLSKTWRMHPDLCAFVSSAIYEGKLESVPSCAEQRLILAGNAHPLLRPAGLSFVPIAHEGCRQRSEQEAEAVRDLLTSLLDQHVVDRYGRERCMGLEDVLIVAPYNMQVNLLRSVLPAGARVGTVDRFQGQEAEAVIISMATSGADDMPRNASFLLSRNRLNVAVSRARCLAVLVVSPGLLDMVSKSVDEMRLANLFCWAAEVSEATA